MGTGKANPVDSKLLTPNGWIRMGDVKVGDYVIGSNGKPTKVIGVYPQGKKDIYELKFNDNTTAQSCEEHLWNVNSPIRISRTNRKLKDYPYQTKTLREIMDSGLQFKNGNNKHYIPIVKPIEFEEKFLKIDPYVLGCILGDGSITVKDSIRFSSIDDQIINEIQNKLPTKHNLVLIKNCKIDYYLTADGKNNLINQYLKEYKLKGCNSHTKFIPHDYKFSSINQRLEILRGIMDTDGTISSDGTNIDLTLASKQLIDDVKFIVQSLGGIARYKTRTSWYGKIDIKPIYHRLSIKLPPNIIPFKLKRKVERYVSPTKYQPNRAIKEIKYIGKKEAQCIMVDASDSLYLIDNCVVTHNSITSISFVEMNDFKKVLVITPNSLKFNYYNEILKFTNSKPHIVNWNKNKFTIEESKYIIVNYEYFNSSDLNRAREKFLMLKIGDERKLNIDTVICDECQKLKNTSSNMYKNFKRFFGKFNKSKVFMSGTPMNNRVYELYTILNQISPIEFPTKNYFYEYYCGMKYDINGFGWDYVSTIKFDELYGKIEPYVFRKRKEDVLSDLPDKNFETLYLELSNSEKKEYGNIENDTIETIFGSYKEGKNSLTILLNLRQYLSSIKFNKIKDIVDTIIDNNEKVVIIDVFKDSLNKIKEVYGDLAVLHTGDFSVEERSKMVNEFQNENSNVKIFLGSFSTSSVGLTLTSANKMFILTLPFSIGEYKQVTDRIHRIGQKKSVNIYPVIIGDTIDNYVFDMLDSKLYETTKIMDNIDVKMDYKQLEIDGLFKSLLNKKKRK